MFALGSGQDRRRIKYKRFVFEGDDGSWLPSGKDWACLGGDAAAAPVVAVLRNSPILHMAFRGRDDAVHYKRVDVSDWQPWRSGQLQWDRLGGNVGGVISVVPLAGTGVEICYQDKNGNSFQKVWRNGRWRPQSSWRSLGVKAVTADEFLAHLTETVGSGVSKPQVDREWVRRGQHGMQLVTHVRGNMVEADLSGAELRYVTWKKGKANRAILEKANIQDVFLDHCVLSGAKLSGARMSGSKIEHTWFTNADMSDADLNDCQAKLCHADSGTWHRVQMKRAKLTQVIFDSSELQGTVASDATFSSCGFNKVVCDGATLRRADIRSRIESSSFIEAHLEHATFTGISLKHLDFTQATLANAVFEKVEFKHGNFDDGHLQRARLVDVHFDRVSWRNADFRKATVIRLVFVNGGFVGNPHANFDLIDGTKLRGVSFKDSIISPFGMENADPNKKPGQPESLPSGCQMVMSTADMRYVRGCLLGPGLVLALDLNGPVIDYSRTIFPKLKVDGRTLNNAILTDANLTNVDFSAWPTAVDIGPFLR